MQPQAAFAVADIEAVAEEFQSANVGDFGLFAVDLKLETHLYKLGDTLLDALSRALAATEDYSIVGITHERMSASFEFLIQFVEHDVGQQRA